MGGTVPTLLSTGETSAGVLYPVLGITLRNVDKLKGVQRRARKVIKGLKNLTYEGRFKKKKLGMFSLGKRKTGEW